MDTVFCYQYITYGTAAVGWSDGVYYPRMPKKEEGNRFLKEQGGMREIRSRVWKETEETGYGVYYYEETTRLCTVLMGNNYKV